MGDITEQSRMKDTGINPEVSFIRRKPLTLVVSKWKNEKSYPKSQLVNTVRLHKFLHKLDSQEMG